MYPLGANQSWFTFSVGPASYAVYAFTGTERVNEPYEFQIEFVFEDSSMPTEGFLGSEGLLSIMDKNGVPRLVHGIIRQIRQLHTPATALRTISAFLCRACGFCAKPSITESFRTRK